MLRRNSLLACAAQTSQIRRGHGTKRSRLAAKYHREPLGPLCAARAAPGATKLGAWWHKLAGTIEPHCRHNCCLRSDRRAGERPVAASDKPRKASEDPSAARDGMVRSNEPYGLAPA